MLAKIVSSYITALSATGAKPVTDASGKVTDYEMPDTKALYENYQASYGPMLGGAGVNIRGYVTGTWLNLIKAAFIVGLIAIFLQVAFSATKGQVTISDMGWALAKTVISVAFIYRPGLLYALVVTVSSAALQLMKPSAGETHRGVVAEAEVRVSMERGFQSSVAVVDGILASEPNDPNSVYWVANLAGRINDFMKAAAKEGSHPPYIVAAGAEDPKEGPEGITSGPIKKTAPVPISSTPNAKTITTSGAEGLSEPGMAAVPSTSILFHTDTRVHADEMFAVKKQIRENLKAFVQQWDTEWKTIPDYKNAGIATRWGNTWARWSTLGVYETPKDWSVPTYWLAVKNQSTEALRRAADPTEGTKIASQAGTTARESGDHLFKTLVVEPAYGPNAGSRWDAGERLAAPFRNADAEESSWMSKFQEWIRSLVIGGLLRVWGYFWLGGIELLMALMLLVIPAWVHPKTEKSFTSIFSVLMTLMIFPACHTVILFLFERIASFAMEKSGAIYMPGGIVTTTAVTLIVFLVSIPIGWKFMTTIKTGGSIVGLAAKTTLAGLGAAATLAFPALRVASMAGSAALAKGATAAGAAASSMGTAAAGAAKAGGLAGYARAATQGAGALGAKVLSWGASGASKAVDFADDTAAKVTGVDDKYLRRDMNAKQKAAGVLSAMNSTVLGGVKAVASGTGASGVFDEIRRGGERKRQAEDFAGKKQEGADVQAAVGEQTKAAERQIAELQAIRKGIDEANAGRPEVAPVVASALAPKTPDFAPNQPGTAEGESAARSKLKLKAASSAADAASASPMHGATTETDEHAKSPEAELARNAPAPTETSASAVVMPAAAASRGNAGAAAASAPTAVGIPRGENTAAASTATAHATAGARAPTAAPSPAATPQSFAVPSRPNPMIAPPRPSDLARPEAIDWDNQNQS